MRAFILTIFIMECLTTLSRLILLHSLVYPRKISKSYEVGNTILGIIVLVWAFSLLW